MYEHQTHVQQLADYLKKNIAKGYTLESLKFSLLNQGYSKVSVEKAIELANQQLAAKAPIMKEKPQITYKIIPDESRYKKNGFFKRLFKFIFK